MGTTGQSITLANSIIGVGILAMPFCFQQCGVLLATLILLFMGLVSRLCCHFLLKSALLARRRNFEFLAFHVFGQAGKLAVEIGIIGFLMGTCIAYFVVVGDLGPQIVAKMFNINQSDILRTSIMVIVSLVCVLPLGLLRNVDSLSNVSAATIAFYFCLVMKVIFEAGAVMMTTSDWNQRVEMWRPAGLLQCVPIFSMALFCQTQLFEIFESLPTLSLEKMNIVTKNAINICTAVYFTLGVFGYIAFSSHVISGNILMSLSPTMASDVIKLGFVMSLAFSFPLIIFPCRASLYSFLYKKVHSSHHDHIINHSIPETTFRCITVAIVAVALFISLLIPNIELVLGLAGSTIGVLICVVFPAACFIYVTFKNTNERILAKGVLVLGLVIMVLGTYANLQVAESSIEHYDDKYTQERIDKIVEDFFENRDKDDVYLKPPLSNDIQKEPPDSVVLNKERKDSEIQPPNPVPPESQSNEKLTLTKNAIKTDEKDVLQVPETKESDDKVSETHPRNLKTKLESQLANGVNNGEAQKPKEDKPQSNEDKIDMIKQQKLIETIKQHGEEQKELIKEQKEILDEILKTKKELQQNKNEAVEANEAKKLAVESIKQIADMAIKSIGGVSEKPDLIKKDEKVEERLEKLTNDAVQEIAKKAVETIEAIQDIKEKPEQPNVAPPVQNIVPNVQPNVQVNPVQNVQPNQNAQANQIVQPEIPLNPPIAEGVNLPVVRTKDEAPIVAANVDPQANSNMNENNAAVVQNVANNNVNQINGAVAQNIIAPNVNPQPIQEAKPVVNEMLNQNAPIPYNNVQKPPEIVKPPLNPGNDAVKHHSHSPDEPQSYKQGEDTQVKPETKIVQNVPLPIVNELANNQMKIDKKPAAQRPSDDIQVNVPPKAENNGANNANVQENVPVANAQPQNVNPAPVRQKREIIDCSEKVLLKPEDKAICRNVVDENMKTDVQLPNPVSLTLTKNTIKADEKEILQVSETKQSEIQLKTKLESKLANDEAQKPKKDILHSNEDKIAMMQQKLTETIKQHGEKQKEMTEEQKKILDEILKTKKEPQQKKEAVGTKETKKIAVESIKQIADMAFKSIGGVSENPEAKNDVKEEERLEKTTNDAMQDKVKKTVGESKSLNGVRNGDTQKPSEDKPIITEQQKHIETIQLHGEKQQKELTKEHKDILDEMLKSQKQLQEVKNLASEAKEAKKKAIQSIRRNNDVNNGNLQENVPKIVNVAQKREVIDCTEKVSLKPEDRAICINLAHENVKKSEEMLPRNVDLNDVVLPKSLPIAANILHHISRQLKSFDKDER